MASGLALAAVTCSLVWAAGRVRREGLGADPARLLIVLVMLFVPLVTRVLRDLLNRCELRVTSSRLVVIESPLFARTAAVARRELATCTVESRDIGDKSSRLVHDVVFVLSDGCSVTAVEGLDDPADAAYLRDFVLAHVWAARNPPAALLLERS